MNTEPRKINPGIYLVVDPSMEQSVLLNKLKLCLTEKLAAVQIWDNFHYGSNVVDIIRNICHLCHEKHIPVLINNRWKLLNNLPLDGVHFDQIPENYSQIKLNINKPFLSGLTCNNDLSYVHWAITNQMNYISFCSVFPSSTSNSCELVDFDTIREASKVSNIPIFLAGGIKPGNLATLNGLNYSGIAVISGIMGSDKPDESIREYYKRLKRGRYEN